MSQVLNLTGNRHRFTITVVGVIGILIGAVFSSVIFSQEVVVPSEQTELLVSPDKPASLVVPVGESAKATRGLLLTVLGRRESPEDPVQLRISLNEPDVNNKKVLSRVSFFGYQLSDEAEFFVPLTVDDLAIADEAGLPIVLEAFTVRGTHGAVAEVTVESLVAVQ